MHRRGTGVVRGSLEAVLGPGNALDAFNRGNIKALFFKYRTLLDM